MSGYKNFAVVGAGEIGSFIIRQLLTEKAAGTVDNVVVLTRQGSKTSVDPDAKLVAVDYSNKESIKKALTGVDVVISTVAVSALQVQPGIAEAAKEVGVKLFVPSEFGGASTAPKSGPHSIKTNIQERLRVIGIPYALFATGPFADFLWVPEYYLDITSGKVSVGADGSNPIPFTSRPDIARYLSYVLTHLPAEQLKNRSFSIRGDTKSFNEIFKEYEAKTGKKVEVTYIPISELDARMASNPKDVAAYLQKVWATPYHTETDNHLYPDWNPSSVIDNILAA
ncbi:NAD-P-binding protein [Lactarius tabidus]